MQVSNSQYKNLTWVLFFLLLFFPSSLSDPRISEAGLYCGKVKAPAKANFIPTFVEEMESISEDINISYWSTHFVNSTPPIYALAQCYQDLSHIDCLLCYAASRTRLPRCLPSISARIYFDGCFLRYDNYSFYEESTDPLLDSVNCSSNYVFDDDPVSSGLEFVKDVKILIDNVTRIAVENGGFGVADVKGVFGLAQCWKTLGNQACRACLKKAGLGVSKCAPKREGRGLNAGCYLRYSTLKFYNDGKETQNRRESNNLGQVSTTFNRSKLKFKYETLEKATDYFNHSKKIGEGGAGSVFKGTLSNGTTVAVKRLVFNTRQWVEEFFNEVNLISDIQHKNLLKLLGCSIEGPESLLVYEYVPNRSLDLFLFEKNKVPTLNWRQRFNIIVGTAEGLAHLHNGCKLRIIHRDIKSSNVLLDENLNPKIADFGLARCFASDQTHLSTGIAGTIGYMAPEYLLRGQLTEKADVYSFGVLVLEVVCGKRNNSSFTQGSGSLLDTVWRLYRSNNMAEAVDPCLGNDFPAKEVSTVLQIGLLCSQASAALRPSMEEVVLMLTTNKEKKIPAPSQPPFVNASVLRSSSSTRSYSIASNAFTKYEASYSSTDLSSPLSSVGPSRSEELVNKSIQTCS